MSPKLNNHCLHRKVQYRIVSCLTLIIQVRIDSQHVLQMRKYETSLIKYIFQPLVARLPIYFDFAVYKANLI